MALEYCERLQYNHEYMFSNGQVKLKKNGNNEFEIKFTEASQILPIQSQSTFRRSETAQNQEGARVEGISVSEVKKKNPGQMVTVVGKISNIRPMSKGRSLELIDKNF